ncbi:MAG: hypothetical protein IT179_04630 [Acidobacteria bacterium]|nr:hypothetical protein [Acidobacteriota bacterium]
MTDQLLVLARSLQSTVLDAAPRVVLGLLVAGLLVGVAKAAEWLLRVLMTRVRFDALLKQAGIDKVLQRLGIRQSLDVVVPRLVYFLLLLLFAQAAADAFGLAAISQAIASLFGYLPNVLAALLVVVVGTSASQFVGGAVRKAAEEAGLEFARALGGLASGFLLFIVGVMAIGQLRFDTEMVRIVTACVLAGFALAFGLSIGLGTRDITRNVLAGFYARKVFAPGDSLVVRGERGVLRAITPTQTILEQEQGLVSVGNSVFLDDVIRQ